MARLEAFIQEVETIPFGIPEARRCAQLREALRRQGKRPDRRAYDLLIAATAIESDLTLVTRNVADFRDIEDLKLHTA